MDRIVAAASGLTIGVLANLTLLFQPQPQAQQPQVKEETATFLSTLTQRQPSVSIPFKRKSVESTPTPEALAGVSVVIPSPDVHQRKQIKASRETELAGISEIRYPTLALERKMAAKRAYPQAKAVNRAAIPLGGNTPSVATATTNLLRPNLALKLQNIAGPEISLHIDDRKLAMLCSTFEFVNEYSIQDGVTQVPDEFNAGCDCGGHCSTARCGCLNTEPDTDKTIIPYHQLPSGQWVLHPNFLARKSMIYECSFRCSCQGNCWNHVVQRGRQIRLEIFDTGVRGLGTPP